MSGPTPARKVRLRLVLPLALCLSGLAGLAGAAPVFLLVATGSLLNVLTGRLSRVVDRSRALMERSAATEGDEHARVVAELRWADRRMGVINNSIGSAVACGIVVCLLVACTPRTVEPEAPRAATPEAPETRSPSRPAPHVGPRSSVNATGSNAPLTRQAVCACWKGTSIR